jgi:hypothetical protein
MTEDAGENSTLTALVPFDIIIFEWQPFIRAFSYSFDGSDPPSSPGPK